MRSAILPAPGPGCRPSASLAAAAVALLAALSVLCPLAAEPFVRGRVNTDAQVNISDAVALLDYLFLGGAAPSCLKGADVDDDGKVSIADAIFLLDFLFQGGAAIPPPYPAAGSDPTPDDLACEESPVSGLTAGPAPLILNAVGSTAQLTVTGKVSGAAMDLHAGDTGTVYSSSNPQTAYVYRDGLVEARSQGASTITVRHGGAEAEVPVTVTAPGGLPGHRVLAVNDLGMHCMDREFSIFSILPPFNVVHAQVTRGEANGTVTLLEDAQVEVRYSPVGDAVGSENSTSVRKTDFWDAAPRLFNLPVKPGEGLLGLYMPEDAPSPGPQPLAFDAARGWFAAAGIPITATDDEGGYNPYPLLRVTAFDRATGDALAHADAVVPVSRETDCRDCHATGLVAASAGFVRWWKDADLEVQTKKNILTIHDYRSHTSLLRSTPVLCARCHYSAALDLAGTGPDDEQSRHSSLSRAVHAFHGLQTDATGAPLFPPGAPPEESCYHCHPGKVTRCQRGAMRTGGMGCNDCHGDMLSVGAAHPLAPGGSLDGANDGGRRRPWRDLPRCQSCHTGDDLSHLAGPEYEPAADGLRLRRAYRIGDASAAAILASNKRFAENDGVLYRFSKGHGGILCENCHGSTHAEWPNAEASHSDNVAATQLQGHAGAIAECKACHAPGSVALGLNGPHGLHAVADMRWIKGGHGRFFERYYRECQACHGADLEGTVLSRALADRHFRIEDNLRVTLAKDQLVSCHLCHRKPVPGGEF